MEAIQRRNPPDLPPIDDSHIPPVDFKGKLPPLEPSALDVIYQIMASSDTYHPFMSSDPFLSASEVISLDKDRQILLTMPGDGTYGVAYNTGYLYVLRTFEFPAWAHDGEGPVTYDSDVEGFIFGEQHSRGEGPALITSPHMSAYDTTTYFIAPIREDPKTGRHNPKYHRVDQLVKHVKEGLSKKLKKTSRKGYRGLGVDTRVSVAIQFEHIQRLLRVLIVERKKGATQEVYGHEVFSMIIPRSQGVPA